MSKLKLGPLADNRPVKITLELPAALHRDLVAYAEALAAESGEPVADPAKLVAPMIERFMSTDRGFAKMRRERPTKVASVVLPKLPKNQT